MAEDYDVITIGGGLAGAALAKRLAESGMRVLVLEREVAFRDRVRGEQMHCWGVAEARALGLYELLLKTCGHEVRYWSVQFVGFGGERVYRARLVVGADGRNSACRHWGGFRVEREPRGRPLSGRAGIADFLAASVAAGAPASWYENGDQAAGPLASFDAADTWVAHPHRASVVLIGDAAASNDPSFGCGLSLTLRDVRVLADRLLAGDDWSAAADAYADEHDRYYGVIHRMTGWARTLFYDPAPAVAPVRERALALLAEDRTRGLDIMRLGPEFPADEPHRRRFFGED